MGVGTSVFWRALRKSLRDFSSSSSSVSICSFGRVSLRGCRWGNSRKGG